MENRVLYTVLNWGLGHATRSVPIVESLLHFGAAVEIASSGLALSFLKKRFPSLQFHNLPDREVRYSAKGARAGLIKRALVQSTINTEQNKFIADLVLIKSFTHIVSDNVYGAHCPSIPCALISHQLSLKTPFGESSINARLSSWINRFSEVWVPDGKTHSVAGDLAIGQKVSIAVNHLGICSRFYANNAAEKKYRIGVILGGPEPQRSILEERLLEIIRPLEGRKILFRGSGRKPLETGEQIEVSALGDGDDMAKRLGACELVIGRSGYSTICDLIAIGSRALLIPTPGQTEQEYLADRMRRMPQFSRCVQEKLTTDVLKRALKKNAVMTEKFDFFMKDSSVIRKFLSR